jgi:perosamine synthetase
MRPLTPSEQRIPVAGPSITDKEIAYVHDAVSRAWYANANEFHERFEYAFAEYVGRAHAIALPSCTSALHLALASLGIVPGDEVVIPDVTWIASAAPIAYVGAQPVFADIDASSWCVDVEAVEEVLTGRTKAVIAVDLYGSMPDMEGLRRLLDSRGIPMIEDAAEAIGSSIGDDRAGSFGAASTFSFHGSKTLTTGEGGMLVTDDEETYRRCLFLRDHGRDPGDKTFRSREIAFKYKMSSMQAALGLAQLERIDELVSKKRAIFAWYRENLYRSPLGADGLVTLNAEPPNVTNSYWMVTVILSPELGKTKEAVVAELAARGVDSRPFFDPLSSLDPYRDLPESRAAADRNTVAYRVAPYGVNLPSALSLTEEHVAYVCAELAAVLRVARGREPRVPSPRSRGSGPE